MSVAGTRPGRALRWGALPLLAALGLWSTGAFGYILPYGSLLRRMLGAREEFSSSTLLLQGSASFFGPSAREAGQAVGLGGEQPELSVEGALFLKVPGKCRLEATSIDTGKTVASSSSSSGGKGRTAVVPAMAALLEQVCPILAQRTDSDGDARRTLEKHLAALKVEVKETSLARQGGKVCYVLGQTDEGKSQFWLYKDTYLPARVIYPDAQGVMWDVRFLDFGSPAAGEYLPRVIEVHKGAELLLRFTALKSESKVKLDDKLFARDG